jgi:hypothetical protein
LVTANASTSVFTPTTSVSSASTRITHAAISSIVKLGAGPLWLDMSGGGGGAYARAAATGTGGA